MDYSVLAMLGNLVAWIFAPLGFSTWRAAALTFSGLVAKENVVATAGSLLSVADAGETDPSLWTAFAGMFPTMAPASPLAPSTCCALRALPPLALSATR